MTEQRSAAASTGQLGMLLFVLSEATFFGMLVIAYVFYQGSPASQGLAARLLDPVKTGAFSVLLFTSSWTVHRALAGLRNGRRRALHGWLAATILLGAGFLVGQGLEYARLLREGQSVGRDLFGSTFFTLTGFHGFHVLVGLLLLAGLLLLSRAERLGRRQEAAVESVSIYWHFVDGVWVVIFAVVYLGAAW